MCSITLKRDVLQSPSNDSVSALSVSIPIGHWPLAAHSPQPTHLLSTNTIYYLVPYYYRVRYDIVFTLIVFGVALNLPEFSVLHDRYDDQHITEYGS